MLAVAVFREEPAGAVVGDLGVEFGERFIDDLADNVAAAEALGIRAHLHTGDVPAVRRALGLSD